MKTYSKSTALSYGILRRLVRPIIKAIWVKRVTGLENIPKAGPAIIALNHQSFFDFLIFSAVAPRNVHFLTAEKFFTHKLWRPLMLLTGQIKVDRHAKDKNDVHESVRMNLEKDLLVGIFPEGTRSHMKDKMLKAFTGIGRYSLEHKVPIVPVGIVGTFDVLSKESKKLNYSKVVEIHVGEPLHFPEHWGKHDERSICMYVTEKALKKIEKLSGKEYPHYEHEHTE